MNAPGICAGKNREGQLFLRDRHLKRWKQFAYWLFSINEKWVGAVF
jgi:hypothetical protein